MHIHTTYTVQVPIYTVIPHIYISISISISNTFDEDVLIFDDYVVDMTIISSHLVHQQTILQYAVSVLSIYVYMYIYVYVYIYIYV